MKKILPPIIWILAFQAIGYSIGLLTRANIPNWYHTLEKSVINPPQIVFPIVWGCLYVILAIVGWILWKNRDKPLGKLLFSLYGVQMLMNWAWTPIFFQFHLIALGFYWIIIMILLTIIIIYMAKERVKSVFFLLIPYCIWLFFAAYLNWAIWLKN